MYKKVVIWEGKESESCGYARGRCRKVSDLEKMVQKIGDLVIKASDFGKEMGQKIGDMGKEWGQKVFELVGRTLVT